MTTIVFIITIGLYGYFGVTITKYYSSLTRSTIDISKLILIWVISMCIGWESFSWVELIGCVLVVLGIVVYNEIFKIGDIFRKKTEEKSK